MALRAHTVAISTVAANSPLRPSTRSGTQQRSVPRMARNTRAIRLVRSFGFRGRTAGSMDVAVAVAAIVWCSGVVVGDCCKWRQALLTVAF